MHPTIKLLEYRRQGAFGKPLLLPLGVAFSQLVSPVVRFRRLTEPRDSAVAGLGTLSAYVDASGRYTAQYQWHPDDPDVPGIYICEVDALNSHHQQITLPDDPEPFLVRILPDVGGEPLAPPTDPEPEDPEDPLADLGDHFNGSTLDESWLWYDEMLVSYYLAHSHLHLSHAVSQPAGTALWHDEDDGFLLYKTVTGNFDVRVRVEAQNADGSAPVPIAGYCVAALQAHDPDRSEFNYVHVGIGSISPAHADRRAEWKSTVDSSSAHASISWPSGSGFLRMTRIGDVFTMYVAANEDGPWVELNSVSREDLPPTLQVGLTLTSNLASPGLAHIHWISYQTP